MKTLGIALIFMAVHAFQGCVKHMDAEPASQQPVLQVPTAFTPNGDGLNDYFVIKTSAPLSYYHIRIYESDNIEVFESGDIATSWDGKSNGQPEPAGNYLYNIEYQSSANHKYTQSGYVQLVR